jgi:hypothetical protein
MSTQVLRTLRSCAALLLLLGAAGCMQIETRVKVVEDGSAIITERIRFSHRLLDMKLDPGGVADMNTLLTKATAEKRAPMLGEGCTLASHDVKDVPGGKQAIAVYKIADLNKLQYVSPYLAFVDYGQNNTIRFKLEPVYKSRAYQGAKAGQMSVSLYFEKAPKGSPQPDKDKPLPPGPSPKEMQVFRDLLPAVRDMLDDFEVRLVLEPYCPISHSGHGLRNPRGQPKDIDILWFSDKQLDRYGSPFVENEEAFLAMVRLDFGHKSMVEEIRSYASNETLPAFLPIGSSYMWFNGGTEICFRPSKQLFDKLFTGKTLNYNEWQENPNDKKVPAEFDKIGWKGEDK